MLVALAVALVVATAGCLGPAPAGGGPVTLTVWESYNNEEHEVFMRVVAGFERTYRTPEGGPVKVVVGRVPFNGLLPKLKAACLTQTTPDVVRVDYAHVVPMAWGNAIVPLDELAGFGGRTIEEFARDFVPAAIQSCIIPVRRRGRVTTHIYGVPDQTTCVALFLNRRLMADAADRLRREGCDPGRAPETWEEFVRYARALTIPARGQYGFAMDCSLWWSFPFFFTFGANILSFDAAGVPHTGLEGPEAVAALEFQSRLWLDRPEIDGVPTPVEAGAWRPGAVSKDQGFINGRYAMVLSGPWNLRTFREAGVDLGVALVPRGGAGSSSTVGGTNMVVFRASRVPGVALDFIRHVSSLPTQVMWANELGQIPVRKDAFDRVDTRGRPELAVFMQQMLLARARPQVPAYDQLEGIANIYFELALKGDLPAREALSRASAEISRKVLDPMREE